MSGLMKNKMKKEIRIKNFTENLNIWNVMEITNIKITRKIYIKVAAYIFNQ